MPDCFISYSTQDQEFATFVSQELRRQGVSTFMASASLQPGQRWSSEIITNLRDSSWVVVLASRAACSSAYVNQEIGGALLLSKALVPIVWDMSPTELPGWLREVQAIDLRGSPLPALRQQIAAIAHRINQQNSKGNLILAAAIVGLILLYTQE